MCGVEKELEEGYGMEIWRTKMVFVSEQKVDSELTLKFVCGFQLFGSLLTVAFFDINNILFMSI